MKSNIQPNILLSICCITYNHELYIEQAINSFLMQKTNFQFEVIIHDDASTDKTASIIEKNVLNHPDLLIPIFQTENQYIHGINPAFKFVFPKCKGKYIALCEGDDYWTDALKLQKQVDFLENNDSYSAASHQSRIVDCNSIPLKHLVSQYETDTDIGLMELLNSHPFQTASFMFRSDILRNAGPFPHDILSGDKALFLASACNGPIKYFSTPMSVYRKNVEGISSKVSVEMMKKDLKILPWLRKINPEFPKYSYLSYLHYTIFAYPANANPDSYSLIDFIKHYFYHMGFSLLSYPASKKQLAAGRRTFFNLLRNRYIPSIKKSWLYTWLRTHKV